MGIQRKSKYGFPPQPALGSTHTQRLVPLSQGVRTDQPWPVLPAGSGISMSNFLPLDGVLIPRSRLSSLNTIRTINEIRGIYPHYLASGSNIAIWVSAETVHGLLTSNGSISRASFVSSFGLGVAGIQSGTRWQYAPAFSGNLSENMVVAAPWPSQGTLVVLYQPSANAAPHYSYLTSAPRAACVGAYDNYILALNCATNFVSRVQWCVRGNPSNWTGEGSGFEDLLDMKGAGTRIMGTSDQRVLVFSDLEIWYGVTASYPAQFQFYPLERGVGCQAPQTIVETDAGIVFLGSDNALRVLPRGGGVSQIISHAVSAMLRHNLQSIQNRSWAVYDPFSKIYHLFVDPTLAGTLRGFALNVVTGEWSFSDYNTPTPQCGISFSAPFGNVFSGRVIFGDSNGTCSSFNSLVANENGSALPSVWQSAPVAADLAGNYKQITQVDFDYRSTSTATITLNISSGGGNPGTFQSQGEFVNLRTAPVSGRATAQVYRGGAFPVLHISSTATGYELHRIDATMNIGGRRAQP